MMFFCTPAESCWPRVVPSASNSSKKMMLGAFSRALRKSALIMFSDSPTHLERISATFTLKNVNEFSVATALPMSVLPHPGGP